MPNAYAEIPASLQKPLVKMEHVTKIFSNGTIALNDMSLTVRQGEFVSLLGPSGCGKSTALRIIAALGDITRGTIDWPSSRISAKGRPEGDISFVFQEPTLMPWATVFGNVYLPLKLRGQSKSGTRDQIMDVLETVGLEDFADAYPRELSGGMKMRVSLARALASEPRILLLDEPFAALDELTRLRLDDDLLHIWQQSKCTVVFVTHSISESAYLAERVAVLTNTGQLAHIENISPPATREGFRSASAYHRAMGNIAAALGHDLNHDFGENLYASRGSAS